MDGALCLAPASLEVDSWHGERDGVSAQPLHPLNAFQLYFTELFMSLASLEECGSTPSEAAAGKAELGGGCQMPRHWKEQEHVSRESFHLLVTVTSAKNSLVFVTSSSLQCLCGPQAE